MTFIYFIIVLGAVVFVHEFGHYLFAKLSNTYVYEFSIGMGKKLWSYKKKGGETEYCLRLVPIGGYVRLAGEEIENDKSVPKNRKMWSKSFLQRFMILVAGALFNFIFAFLLLFFIGSCYGSPITKPIIGKVSTEYPAYQAGLREGDVIISINDETVTSWDDALFKLQLTKGEEITFEIIDKNNIVKEYKVTPVKEENDGEVSYIYGMSMPTQKEYGIVSGFDYAISKTQSLFKMMFDTFGSLFNGKVGVKDLSGPVGIYTVVGNQAKSGLQSLLYLIAFISINVGFINLIPFPAFDGGRILFLIIEKIKGSPISPKVENMIHNIGFFMLLALMVYITFQDIIRLFN